jgi:hypothetical protein
MTPWRLLLLQLAFPVGCMTVKGSGGSKLTQLVTHHIFRYKDRNKLLPIMDGERQPDKVRGHR